MNEETKPTSDQLEALKKISAVPAYNECSPEMIEMYAALIQTPVRVKGVYFGFPQYSGKKE